MQVLSALHRMRSTTVGRFGLSLEFAVAVFLTVVISGSKHPWAGLIVLSVLFGAAWIVNAAVRWAVGGQADEPPTSAWGRRAEGRMDVVLTMPLFVLPAALLGVVIHAL